MDKLQEAGFLSRWSRLKRGAGEEAPEAAPPPDADPAPHGAFDATGEAPLPAPALTDADLPDPDSLDAQSDFSGFLGEGISEALRRKALKKLFHLPEFNLRDGLNEYDEDFSRHEPLGDTVTYQMKQWLERQQRDFKEALESGEEPAADPETGTRSQTPGLPDDAEPRDGAEDSF